MQMQHDERRERMDTRICNRFFAGMPAVDAIPLATATVGPAAPAGGGRSATAQGPADAHRDYWAGP